MEVSTRSSERRLAEATRRKPLAQPVLHVVATGMGDCGPPNGEVPGELHLEATNKTGEAAEWLQDRWWMETLGRWQDHPLAVHILPTPGALLHPVVIHHLEMLYRVASRWRRVGHCYVDDVVTDQDVCLLAISSYHEVRVIDSFRPDTGKSEAELRGVTVDRLIGRVMRARAAAGATRPLLIRVPTAKPPVNEGGPAEASAESLVEACAAS